MSQKELEHEVATQKNNLPPHFFTEKVVKNRTAPLPNPLPQAESFVEPVLRSLNRWNTRTTYVMLHINPEDHTFKLKCVVTDKVWSASREELMLAIAEWPSNEWVRMNVGETVRLNRSELLAAVHKLEKKILR